MVIVGNLQVEGKGVIGWADSGAKIPEVEIDP